MITKTGKTQVANNSIGIYMAIWTNTLAKKNPLVYKHAAQVLLSVQTVDG